MLRLAASLVVALAACDIGLRPAPVRLAQIHLAGQRTLAVIASPDARINARLPPAIELSDGSVLRLARGRISADSAYFLDPPWEIHPGTGAIRGALRVSYCRRDEALCRSVVLPIAFPAKRKSDGAG